MGSRNGHNSGSENPRNQNSAKGSTLGWRRKSLASSASRLLVRTIWLEAVPVFDNVLGLQFYLPFAGLVGVRRGTKDHHSGGKC